MTSNQLSRSLVLVAILGCLFTMNSAAEARTWDGPQQQQQQHQGVLSNQGQYSNGPLDQAEGSNLDRLDSDDDYDDDDRVQLQPAGLPQQAGANLYQREAMQQFMPKASEQADAYQQQQQQQPSSEDLRVAASKHYGHHKHGAKGWLDMGAWTGKKGAFGWYDKHPVGKGK